MKRRKQSPSAFSEMDISHALTGWAFQPGQVNVRLIRGNDGKPKLQLRLDLGLLQMELEGRPDGKRPHRASTELDFQRKKLGTHRKRVGSDDGFQLTSRDCQALREESAMFYHRYLSLFVLEQYDAVIRDTQHNLDVLDLCSRYGKSEYDRMCLEQYRPYILMMNTRAKACDALRQGYVQTAIAYLRGGIKRIAHLVEKDNRRKFLRQSNEARILLDMLKQIRAQLPPDPRKVLQSKLKEALAAEKYEEAASLRDQLQSLSQSLAPAAKPSHSAAAASDAGEDAAMLPSPAPVKKARRPRKPRKADRNPEDSSE
jgi:hypothetical protein